MTLTGDRDPSQVIRVGDELAIRNPEGVHRLDVVFYTEIFSGSPLAKCVVQPIQRKFMIVAIFAVLAEHCPNSLDLRRNSFLVRRSKQAPKWHRRKQSRWRPRSRGGRHAIIRSIPQRSAIRAHRLVCPFHSADLYANNQALPTPTGGMHGLRRSISVAPKPCTTHFLALRWPTTSIGAKPRLWASFVATGFRPADASWIKIQIKTRSVGASKR